MISTLKNSIYATDVGTVFKCLSKKKIKTLSLSYSSKGFYRYETQTYLFSMRVQPSLTSYFNPVCDGCHLSLLMI